MKKDLTTGMRKQVEASKGVRSLVEENSSRKAGRPVSGTPRRKVPGWSFDHEIIEKVKQLAYWDRKPSPTAVAEKFIRDGLEQYEKQKGPLNPIPKEQ